MMAGQQSTGTLVALARETGALPGRHATQVESIAPRETVSGPSLPGASAPPGAVRDHLPPRRGRALLAARQPRAVASQSARDGRGQSVRVAPVLRLRLLDLALPDAFARRYPGPQFGIAGTRRLTGVETGPILGTIIKPSVGLSPEETGELVAELCEAGHRFHQGRRADGRRVAFAPSTSGLPR